MLVLGFGIDLSFAPINIVDLPAVGEAQNGLASGVRTPASRSAMPLDWLYASPQPPPAPTTYRDCRLTYRGRLGFSVVHKTAASRS